MRHDDNTRLLTIRDVAAAIAFGNSDGAFERALRQVRHWTQNDLLETYGDKNTGRGVPRLYEEERTIEIAAILIELSRYGVTLEVMKPVAEELYSVDADLYLLETETDQNAYIQVSWEFDPDSGRVAGADINLFDDIDIAQGNLLDPKPSSSIVVHMTEVMDRLRAKRASKGG